MNWNKYFSTRINDIQLQQAFVKYAGRLENNNFPVIFDLSHLCLLIGVNEKTLVSIINSKRHFYRSFSIPKRNSESLRRIDSPYPILKKCQDWIKGNILENIEVAESCYSYKKSTSIIHNAEKHLSNKTLYKLDLQDFFPSINLKRVISIFINCGYSYKVSYYLTAICILENKLPQGAPTSPIISNIVCKRLDKRLEGLSKKFKVIYTRYADDLTFSGERVSINCVDTIKKIIISEGFNINQRKELLVIGHKKKKIVTGISISNDTSLKLPRNQKRIIKQEVFKFLKYSHGLNPNLDDFDPLFPERLLGKLNFWRNVEKDKKIDALIEKVKQKHMTLMELFSSQSL